MKWLVKYLFVFLCFFSSAAWADSYTPSGAGDFVNTTDLSANYLGQIFGTVGTVLHGTGGEVLSRMFYQYNEGVLILTTMWVGYTVLTSAVKAFAEGINHKPGHVYLIFLRISIGFAALVPLSTGYTSFQSIVMKVVEESVNLADQVWSSALDYMQAGGVLYEVSETNTGAAVDPNTGVPLKQQANYQSALTATYNVLEMQTCVNIKNLTECAGPNASTTCPYAMTTDTNGNFYFGNKNPQDSTCGKINADNMVPPQMNGSPEAATAIPVLQQVAATAVGQVVDDIQDAATALACQAVRSTTGSCAIQDPSGTVTDGIANGAIDFQQQIRPIYQAVSLTGDSTTYNFIQNAKSDGWMMAGRNYWAITNLNDQLSGANGNGSPDAAVSISTTFSTPTDPQTLLPNLCFPGQGCYQAVNGSCDQNPPPSPPSTLLPASQYCPINEEIRGHYNKDNHTENSANDNTSNGAGIAAMTGYTLASGFIGGIQVGALVAGAVQLLSYIVDSGMTQNPILFLHMLGMKAIGSAATIFFVPLGAIFATAMGVNICSAEQPSGQASKDAMTYLMPLLMIVFTMLLATGIFFAYYVPLYPYFLYTFACVGWFILVLEAMAAAPLVALGVTHPEGNDFLGQAQQALMLLLSVFVRPALIVIGLVAAILLSYVALSMVTYGFYGVVADVFNNNTTTIDAAAGNAGQANGSVLGFGLAYGEALAGASMDAGPFGLVLLFIILPIVMMTLLALIVDKVMTQCYSLIHHLPDNIMRWLGAPTMANTSEAAAQQIEQGLQSGNQAARGAGEAASKFGEGTKAKALESKAASKGAEDASSDADKAMRR